MGLVGTVTDQDVAELVRRVEEATVAYAQGDMKRYVALLNHADPFTLADPLVHPIGFDRLAELARGE